MDEGPNLVLHDCFARRLPARTLDPKRVKREKASRCIIAASWNCMMDLGAIDEESQDGKKSLVKLFIRKAKSLDLAETLKLNSSPPLFLALSR